MYKAKHGQHHQIREVNQLIKTKSKSKFYSNKPEEEQTHDTKCEEQL